MFLTPINQVADGLMAAYFLAVFPCVEGENKEDHDYMLIGPHHHISFLRHL